MSGMNQLKFTDVKFGDKLRPVSGDRCLKIGTIYSIYRTIHTSRLYVVCIGPHKDNPEAKDERGHTRHYLDQCLDPTGTYLVGWERID